MRAIGLSKGSAFRLLLCDQFLLSGSAIVIGILVGNLGSLLFVPLFQLVNDPASQIVPFRVIAKVEDANKIYIMLGCLLIICMAVLVRMILRIRVDQAIKLGEE
jgi:putative ABC transport system permease protein